MDVVYNYRYDIQDGGSWACKFPFLVFILGLWYLLIVFGVLCCFICSCVVFIRTLTMKKVQKDYELLNTDVNIY